jgi:DNA polymerase-1
MARAQGSLPRRYRTVSKTWIIIDCPNLVYRAYFSTGKLSYKDRATGVLFGFFRELKYLQDKFGVYLPVFCWDVGESKRMKILPTYKKSRKERWEKMSEEEREGITRMRQQATLLRTKYLKQVGYRNNFWADGYEADDVIASVVMNLPVGDKAVVVSSDKDLYQLLTWPCRVYDPRSKMLWTNRRFFRHYGVRPTYWADVKALAGDAGDDIDGLEGVGIKPAIKHMIQEFYPNGKPKPGPKGEVYKRISAALKDRKWIMRQMKLVGIPFEGCPTFRPQPDKLDHSKLSELYSSLGFKTLKF